MLDRSFLSAITIASLSLLIAGGASANRVNGVLQGVFPGNDSVQAVLDELGLEVVELAKVDIPSLMNGGLSLTVTAVNDDDEPIAGDWDFSGPGVVDLIVVKAGPNWAAYLYNDVITNNMPNLGLWDTTDLSDKGLSHVTAYSIIPEPTTALLVGLGLAVLGRGARTRRRS